MEVGQFKSNSWNLYDMHGNAWKWCQDWSFSYDNKTLLNPIGPSNSKATELELETKVVRGGSYAQVGHKARSANRWEYLPAAASNVIGFRIVMQLDKK